METTLDYFGKRAKEARRKYRSFVEDLLRKEYDSPFLNTFGTAVLGTAEFIEMVTSEHLSEKGVDRAVPGIRQFKSNPEPEEILKAVAAVIGENEKLSGRWGCSAISTVERNLGKSANCSA